jgi:two-component system CheB/CheR fusion protein
MLFHGRLHGTDIAVDTQVGKEVPIVCMPSETLQIFANLVANAVEAMQGSGRLRVRLRSSCDWRDRKTAGMRVTIGDTGIGIDRLTRHHIFEPFFTTKTDTGTGLGLWVVAQLVDRHKGSVSVWSSQRKGASGTVFSIFLPIGSDTTIDDSAEGGVAAPNKGPFSEEASATTVQVILESRKA